MCACRLRRVWAAAFIAALREADRVAEAVELRLDYLEAAELPGVLDWLVREWESAGGVRWC
jgi:hypothetical protein